MANLLMVTQHHGVTVVGDFRSLSPGPVPGAAGPGAKTKAVTVRVVRLTSTARAAGHGPSSSSDSESRVTGDSIVTGTVTQAVRIVVMDPSRAESSMIHHGIIRGPGTTGVAGRRR